MYYLCNMSRLSIEISKEQHQKIKALSALQGKSIKDFILSKLFSVNNEDEKNAMKQLEELLLTRIKQAENHSISSKSFQEITDDEISNDKS